jgi:ribosomal protein S18 acetylase RimI-like enzyme
MQIVAYQASDFDRVVEFITRLNGDSAHHIGYFDTDVEHTLDDLTPPLVEGMVLAVEGTALVGVLGLELDDQIGRAWLYGPLIDHPDWHPVADRLYAAARERIPPTIGQHEIFCEARNLNCQQFAERHQFKPVGQHITFTLRRAGLSAIPAGAAVDWDPRFFDQFNALHDQTFPQAYYTAQQIIDRRNPCTRLWIDVAGDDLRGYLFGNVDPDTQAGYIDFIGVDERFRRQGIGRQLLATALHWMFSVPEVGHVGLTVNAANAAAVRLYDTFGFERERTLCGFRTG